MSHLAPESSLTPGPRTHAGRSGRVARLALKELRESLRDRRTLITLVLMPLLLYPLLSLILRKFLLTGLLAGAVPTFHLAFFTDGEAEFINNLITQGREILARRQRNEPLPDLKMFSSKDAEKSLRSGEVDVIIRVTRMTPANFQPGDSWEVDCELIVIEGSATGERAARHVEDCLRAFGSRVIAAHLRDARVAQRPTPIRTIQRRISNPSQSNIVSLSALIPFVLILMTITGAVYPAIDLTAGERERGTLELLIAAPVPRLGLLFAKYVAVLTVAMLTAVVNLVAMTGTVVFSGLGPLLWGEKGLSLGTVVAVFFLLLLLASFFAAVLLTITSFARSFKEAQAYLIPLMLCALGPGLISLMPGVQLKGWLVVTPLLNVALLSRDILQGEGSLVLGTIVVASTALYAFAALALAANWFAADAVLYDARLGWAELWRRPVRPAPASVALALLCLACMFPISFAANGGIAQLSDLGIAGKLVAMAFATAFVFGGVPLLFVYWRRVPWIAGLQWRWPPIGSWLGAALLGLALWPFAHEITLATQVVGLVSLETEHFVRAKALMDQCRTLPVWLVVFAFAIGPAIFEEFCFRGFVFGALRQRLAPWSAVLASGALFGVFHLVATDALAVERLVPSTLMGIVLGWVCYRTNSLFPGMVLHGLYNGLLSLLFYYLPELQSRGWGIEERSHLPWTWLVAATVGAAFGFLVIYASSRGDERPTVPER